jgi:hypothetical protein
MRLQLRAIAIYSRDGERRDIRFHLGALNIVTGASKTGKSALLDIVDYCWGRTECTIAEGEIRRGVSWFAVLFDRDDEGILIARKNPGPAEKQVMRSILSATSMTFPPLRSPSSRMSPQTRCGCICRRC